MKKTIPSTNSPGHTDSSNDAELASTNQPNVYKNYRPASPTALDHSIKYANTTD